jgi:hypothetical protein
VVVEGRSGAEHWRTLLAAWREAERRGQDERALDLLVELVTTLQVQWSKDDGRGPSSLGFQLLNSLGTKLQERSLHEAALHIYGSARQYAGRQDDHYGAIYFGLRGAQSCVALLDFQSAAQVLGQILGIVEEDALLHDVDAAAMAASTLSAPRAEELDVHFLRVEALLSLGRYLAACGKLAAADVTLRRVLALLEEHESPTISTPDVHLRLAEVRLDRGDFTGAEETLAAAAEREQGRATQLKWRLLQGQLRHLQGRFSEAEELLGGITRGPHPLPLQPLLIAATWQRIHTLASLNRLDDAENLLDELAAGEASVGLDVEGMRTLLAARRSAATIALHLPPPSRQVLVASEPCDAPPTTPVLEDLGVAAATVRRTSERARDDYGRLFNGVLLALHQGHRDTALLVSAHISDWVADLDSELIAARQMHLWALVYYYWNDLPTAEAYATDAQKAYATLGMLGEQWAMCRLRGWSLHRRHAPQALRERNRREMIRLQDQMTSRLQPVDRALYGLNKWSAVDEEIAAICATLDRVGASVRSDTLEGWYRRQRRQRLTKAALRKILWRRRQHHRTEARESRKPPDDVSAPYTDVYQLALQTIGRRLVGEDKPAIARRLTPCWMPADTAVLHYVVLPDRLELFLITLRGCERVPLQPATSRPDLWERVRATLVHLHGAQRWLGDRGRLPDLAVRLGIANLDERLPASVQYLAIVPDDILAHVPFAALPMNGRPCIARYSLSVLPAMVWLERSPQQPCAYESGLGVAVTSSIMDGRYPPLEGAVHELRAIRKEWTNGWVRLADKDATRDQVRGRLSDVDLAHFTCHGDFFPDNPDGSGLLLCDGWLTIGDIYGLRLDHLALAVLASCWGASTAVLPGNVHVGMPFALIDRGAKAVIASLWEVAHASNILFAQTLYEAIGQHGPIGGLAIAQRQEWARQTQPANWAGYVAYAGGIAPRQPIRWLLRLLSHLRHSGAAQQ